MKSFSCFAAGLFLGLSVTAEAQPNRQIRFQQLDLNGDGVITRDEWRGNDRSFRNQDWNGDGVLSGIELRIGARRPAREPGVAGTSGRQDRFTDLDRNGDGRLTRNEWVGSGGVFDALDANGDGVVTRAEAIGRTGGGQGSEFRSADANGDGVISRNEWAWNASAFDRLDANRDGRLTRDEFDNPQPAAMSQQSAAFRSGFERGRQEGVQAGREDKPRGWDLEGQRELETADSGYQPRLGQKTEYQAGYRTGFRRGYREGFGVR
jgi:hypothetical protein